MEDTIEEEIWSDKTYPMNMTFAMRLRMESKGKKRPEILSVDWNPRPSDCGVRRYLVAACHANRTRIFGKVDMTPADRIGADPLWIMMHNEPHPHERKAIKWCPTNGKVIAAAEQYGTKVDLNIMKWKDNIFQKELDLEVSDCGIISSIEWNDLGTYLLVTLDPSDSFSQGTMAVIRYPADATQCLKKTIHTGYWSKFCAVFRPLSSNIFSVSADSNMAHLWCEDDEQPFNWIRVSDVCVGNGISRICFKPDGYRLAAIGKKLLIWNYSETLEEGKWNIKLEPFAVDSNERTSRTKGASLKGHCENVIALEFTSDGHVITGSSIGSICIHEEELEDEIKKNEYEKKKREKEKTGQTKRPYQKKKRFKVACFQFSHVNCCPPAGRVNCALSNPVDEVIATIASGGQDGLAILWDCYRGPRIRYKRNYCIDQYCYDKWTPELTYPARPMMEPDCQSVSSIGSNEVLVNEGNESPTTEGNESPTTLILAEISKVQRTQETYGAKLDSIEKNFGAELKAVNEELKGVKAMLEKLIPDESKDSS